MLKYTCKCNQIEKERNKRVLEIQMWKDKISKDCTEKELNCYRDFLIEAKAVVNFIDLFFK